MEASSSRSIPASLTSPMTFLKSFGKEKETSAFSNNLENGTRKEERTVRKNTPTTTLLFLLQSYWWPAWTSREAQYHHSGLGGGGQFRSSMIGISIRRKDTPMPVLNNPGSSWSIFHRRRWLGKWMPVVFLLEGKQINLVPWNGNRWPPKGEASLKSMNVLSKWNVG